MDGQIHMQDHYAERMSDEQKWLLECSEKDITLMCLKGMAAIASDGQRRAGPERKPFWGSEGAIMGWVIIVS